MEDIKQRKGEAEMAAADWLLYCADELKDGDSVSIVVTSGDIDAVVIIMFVVARLWPRKEDNMFSNAVYVLLQKPSGTDVYCITSIVEQLEHVYGDKNIASKIPIVLCLGGNDFVPKFYGINHLKILDLFLKDSDFCDRLFKINDGTLTVNKEVYIQFIKFLYCRKGMGNPRFVTFDEVKRSSMLAQKSKAGATGLDKVTDPRKWLPPKTALESMCQLLQLQIEYLLTAGTASAFLPDFLTTDCLKQSPSGEVEYNFGSESYLTSSELSQITESIQPKTPVKKGKKRTAIGTPQKGRRRKVPLSSTPVKGKRS